MKQIDGNDFISITDMIDAKDGSVFVSDWLRNRNRVEFLGIWESINNPERKGNMRDYAPVEQLIVLANLESYNAIVIEQGFPQPQRMVFSQPLREKLRERIKQ